MKNCFVFVDVSEIPISTTDFYKTKEFFKKCGIL